MRTFLENMQPID